MSDSTRDGIYVLAGPNGAGKSSIVGRAMEAIGGRYFNPDEFARELREDDDSLSEDDANSIVWEQMVGELGRAIDERRFFAFESTLGGNTITELLLEAAHSGIDVSVRYIALNSAEAHIERVRQRVSRGGHPVDEDWIRRRYVSSRGHVIELMPHLAELFVYDNSQPAPPPEEGGAPEPLLILHMQDGCIASRCAATRVPEWAKPIVLEAIRLSGMD